MNQSQNASFQAGQAKGQTQEKTNQMMDKASDAMQSAKESCQEAGQQMKEKAQGAADAVKDTEEIGTWVNVNDEAISVVNVNIKVRRKVNSVFGRKAVKEERVSHDGFVWFRVCERSNRRGSSRGSVGLSVAIVQKMKWVQEEGWWIDGREKEVSVERVEEIRSEGWKKFGCCVLVESFVLRRMDGTLVLRSDFRHTHRVQCKWE
ncbi:hypothetical protein LWI28_001988 [Acer negundo]|uniref:Uncharacterized protein n=1 Tax=Acer negundo TaxID=4023 RepID=A0AAD5NEP9_ACENE|nr:hypothetical protein LWI28_001988 [Acer negundo]